MPTNLAAWRPVFTAMAVLLVLLSTGAGLMNWQLASVDTRLDERLAIYHKEMDAMSRRIERLEERLNR